MKLIHQMNTFNKLIKIQPSKQMRNLLIKIFKLLNKNMILIKIKLHKLYKNNFMITNKQI